MVVSNPSKTRAIAEAKVKTDKVDARRSWPQLLAADFLPPVWLPDAETRALRRQVRRRGHIVRQRTRLKNQVHAILARNLVARLPRLRTCSGLKGRDWLADQDRCRSTSELPRSGAAAAARLPWRGTRRRSTELARRGVRPTRSCRRLMTIPGVDAIVGVVVVLAVGDFARFRRPGPAGVLSRVEPAGPSVRQLSPRPRPDHQDRPRSRRGMLVEAAWSASRGTRAAARRSSNASGPARLPDRDRRHRTRSSTVLAWHLASAKIRTTPSPRPRLVAHKRRKLELRAGRPSPKDARGASPRTR